MLLYIEENCVNGYNDTVDHSVKLNADVTLKTVHCFNCKIIITDWSKISVIRTDKLFLKHTQRHILYIL